jgi:hypothetical protein
MRIEEGNTHTDAGPDLDMIGSLYTCRTSSAILGTICPEVMVNLFADTLSARSGVAHCGEWFSDVSLIDTERRSLVEEMS